MITTAKPLPLNKAKANINMMAQESFLRLTFVEMEIKLSISKHDRLSRLLILLSKYGKIYIQEDYTLWYWDKEKSPQIDEKSWQ